MSTTARHLAAPSRRVTRRVLALLAAGAVFGVGGTATLASWTTNEVGTGSFTSNTFATVSKDAADTTYVAHPIGSPVTLTFNGTGMSPATERFGGIDIKTSAATDTAGTLQLTGSTASGTLATYLQYRTAVTTPATSCASATYSGSYTTVSSAAALATPPALNTAGGSPVRVCFDVQMLSTAPVSVQGGSAAVTWTFTATSNS